MIKLMQLVLERGSIDEPLNFDVGLIQLTLHHCAHLKHAKVFSIQKLQYFSQIATRVCTECVYVFILFINYIFSCGRLLVCIFTVFCLFLLL